MAEIVVTAQKRSQSINDVPESITAVGRDQLISQGITDVQSLVKVTPGLSFVESGNSVPVFSLRGVGFFDTSIGARPTVSVYVDEAPLPFSVEAAGASFDLDRVEVLKGPQGTLFGSNSTGGAINYIAAKPLTHFEAGTIDSYARFNTSDIQGYVTGPVLSDLDARLALRTVHSSAYQESYTRDAHLGDQSFTQGRLLFDWHGIKDLKVTLNINGFYDAGDTQAGQFEGVYPNVPQAVGTIPLLNSYPVAPRNDRAADFNPNQPLRKDNSFFQGVLRADYKLNNALTLTSLSTYSSERISQIIDIDGTALNNALATVKGHVSSLYQELRLTGNARAAQWLVGANYSYDQSSENDFYSYTYATANVIFEPTAPFDATNPFGSQIFNTTAVFGNLDYNLTNKLVLHGGVRFTQANLNYSACTRDADENAALGQTAFFNELRGAIGESSIAPISVGQCTSLNSGITPALLHGSFNQNNYSWRTGLDYKLARHALLYFNVSKGFKGGSIPVTAATSNIELKPVNQESVLAYEGGLKVELLDRKLDLTGAGFYYDYTNKQVLGRILDNPNLLGPLEALVNIPKSEVTGGEFQATAFPLQGLTFTAAATYLATDVTSQFINYDILGNQENFQGNPFPYTPKWQVVFDGEYKFPLRDGIDGLLGANVNYRTSTTAGFGGQPVLDINAYALLDLRAAVASSDGRWRAEVFGRNVTDTYYYTNVAKFFDVARRLAGQPATYGIQLSYRYD